MKAKDDSDLMFFKRLTYACAMLCLLFITLFCSKEDNTTIEVRLKNVSEYGMTNIFVATGGGENVYGDLEPNMFSDYRTYEFGYGYAYFSVTIEGEEFVIQPTDYVGEKKLVSGRYTYEVGLFEDNLETGSITVKLIKD